MTTGYWARLDRTVSSWHYVIDGGQTCLSCEKVSEQDGDAERIHRAKHLADSLEIAQAVVRLIEREIENERY